MKPVVKAVIMDKDGLKRAINRIAYEIIEKNGGASNITLIGIKRRGAVVARRIADKISEVESANVPVDELDITNYRDDVVGDRPKDKKPLSAEIEGKTVILVDDVLYTGRTIRAAIDAVFDCGRAKNIQLAVIVDRGHRELPFRPDYVGKNIPTSVSEKVQVMVEEYDGCEGVSIFAKEADSKK